MIGRKQADQLIDADETLPLTRNYIAEANLAD
jgi:hypothetical protein